MPNDSSSEAVELDRIDQAILNILAVDGRVSMTSLAEQVGLSKTPVLARVRRLETEGVILNYRASLSPSKLGCSHVAFVETRLLDTREAALRAFNAAVVKVPEIEECHMIAGGYDYLLKVRTRDIAEYRRVMSEKISSLPHVSSTSTFVAMETVKETALTLS
ncbi:Lrp/AsnC family transcriptional regulator [Roseibium limicola]|uniref:Lrp/AsnC ligand binding domain-containing protein n=1 Tax=Roseibium limicola TaxID=2816037 RepID=A0A939ELK7_9HYPH|nr:Lrp/AsnC ligand binding domain-containing protein [Roseibium limicola]MBO0344682.1 Lrp/AsnC ligand binding domain-containing protein [Roseibium limicola]